MGSNLVIFTGSTGRVATLLRKYWEIHPPKGLKLLWAGRGGPVDIFWDIINGPLPDFPKGAVFVHLAGRVSGTREELLQNSQMIAPLLAACRLSKARGVIFASTAAVYPQQGQPGQEASPDPVNDYGRAKLAAEQLLAQLAQDIPHVSLRLGNIAGADALLGQKQSQTITLDPVAGREGGPERSWIGPISLAKVLEKLITLIAQASPLPQQINVAAQPALKMGDILNAAGKKWHYGPPREGVVPSATLATDRLSVICGEITNSPESLVSEVNSLK